MIDIHSHLLPGLDDGSKSWEMTLEMCRLAMQDGITHIVATPHANDTYTYSRDRARDLVVELSASAAISIFHLRISKTRLRTLSTTRSLQSNISWSSSVTME